MYILLMPSKLSGYTIAKVLIILFEIIHYMVKNLKEDKRYMMECQSPSYAGIAPQPISLLATF